ncbi:type II secretion system F family protein [Caballeronia concitans]|uniref:Type IV pilus assembly protein PilC n=1 Tax=Caballeronia concitans TaxID=1777133 RepID=A0A658R1B1_9BURK|nr:type II secretion system F family protein [Caballeronia concitans]KIG08217.1 Type II secretion system F domain-containing protein [Burkholderia sp. MR1]SAL39289.1 type IV pilus assembly protein PilC [Caballeronia concitans]
MSAQGTSEIRFAWRGVDSEGARKSGKLIAADAASARASLRRDGVIVLELEARGDAPPAKASAADVGIFTRQLAGLLRAGLPLAGALEMLGNAGGRGGLPRIVRSLARDITRGVPFSAALASHPSAFGALYCQLVAVGEVAGALPAVLARLADDRERASAQRAKLRAALAYPVMVLLLSLAITAGLLIGVVPTFKTIFDGFGAALPAPTRFVLALSDAVARHGLPFVAVCVCAGLVGARWIRRSAEARETADRITLKLPIVGALLRSLAVARWSRALGTLLAAGTPLSDAFDSLAHATGNHVFDRATVDIAARLRNGERLAAAMRALGCFPQDVVQPIAVAEESGSLDAMLLDLAALADRQVDERIGAFASLCEPLVITVLGALVGGLVIAMYLPIIQLGNVV